MIDFADLLYTADSYGANICTADVLFAYPIIERIKPKVIVEIGTYLGGSAKLWIRLFHPDTLITIDSQHKTDFDGTFYLRHHYLHQYPSQDLRTVADVERILYGRFIDFLFIDGGHLYDEVKRDFELYSQFVRVGGLVMFHDIYNYNPIVEVPLFWNELKARCDVMESPADNDSSGVGLLVI